MSDIKKQQPKAPAPVAQAPVAVAEPMKQVRAVYGDMIDPYTNLCFTTVPQEAAVITGWMQAQIDAGKLVLE